MDNATQTHVQTLIDEFNKLDESEQEHFRELLDGPNPPEKETASFLHPHSVEMVKDEDVLCVNDLILALERFRAQHGDAARVAFTFDDGNEIHPFQFVDLHDGWYDHHRGDVCNVELVQ